MKVTLRLYMDTEFTGLHKETTLISVGIVAEDNTYFYAEFLDYDETQLNDWLIENVVAKLKFKKPAEGAFPYYTRHRHQTPLMKEKGYRGFSIEMQGTKQTIREALTDWLEQFDTVEFVGDCCHFDFVLLLDLLADHVFDVTSHIAPVCFDINQALMIYYDCDSQAAFDLSRELLCEYMGAEIPTEEKHQALYDAYVIKAIDEFLREEPQSY